MMGGGEKNNEIDFTYFIPHSDHYLIIEDREEDRKYHLGLVVWLLGILHNHCPQNITSYSARDKPNLKCIEVSHRICTSLEYESHVLPVRMGKSSPLTRETKS